MKRGITVAGKCLLALDAGHCISTPGRRCSKEFDPDQHREWWLNDRIARAVQARAAQYEGFTVFRTDDVTGKVDVRLAERCRVANAAGADFFLSIHHNGGINGGSGGGLVAYSYPGSAVSAEWRDALYDAVLAAGKLKGNRATPKATANYAVLRQTNMPAVLIEHGFMDSSTDVPVILTDTYATACGFAEADCIAARFGLQRKKEDEMTQTQFNAMLRAALSIESTGDEPSSWAVDACEAAKTRGLITGNGRGDYGWQTPITREQLAVILQKLN